MATDDLLNELAAWCDEAAIGDNGERPTVDLERSRGKWEASAYSFYDGSGTGKGTTPEEALSACLADLRAAPSRQSEAERQSVVYALSRVLRLSHDEARRRLDAVEGWTDG